MKVVSILQKGINDVVDELDKVITNVNKNAVSTETCDEKLNYILSELLDYVLIGDYVDDLKKSKSVLESIQNIKFELDLKLNDLNAAYFNSLIEQVVHQQIFFKLTAKVQEFFTDVCNNLEAFLKHILDRSVLKLEEIYKEFTLLETDNYTLIEFIAYLNLYMLEYSISEEVKYFELLKELERRVLNSHKKQIRFTRLQIISSRISFLKYKWRKRHKYNRIFITNHIDENFSKKYVFDDEEFNLNEQVKIGDPHYSYFQKWCDKIEFHYFYDEKNWSDDFKFIPPDSKEEFQSIRNDYFLFSFIKFFKDIDPKYEVLNEKLNKVEHSGDIKEKNKLYFFNNVFSMLIENKSIDDSVVMNFFKRIESLNTRHLSNNYFTYFKLLDYKITRCNDLISKRENGGEISIPDSELKGLLDRELVLCNNLYSNMISKFEWTCSNINLLFHFDKQECIIEIGGKMNFCPSVFLLPFSITENRYRINELNKRMIDLKHKILDFKYNLAYLELKETINDSQKKSIETISIFTAVISFIVGSIGGFKFIDNIHNAIAFTLSFGLCLYMFISLILQQLRKERFNFFSVKLPIIISLIVLIIFTLKLSEKTYITKDNLRDELLKMKVDVK